MPFYVPTHSFSITSESENRIYPWARKINSMSNPTFLSTILVNPLTLSVKFGSQSFRTLTQIGVC